MKGERMRADMAAQPEVIRALVARRAEIVGSLAASSRREW